MSKSIFDSLGIDRSEVKNMSAMLQQQAAIQNGLSQLEASRKMNMTKFCFACVRKFNSSQLSNEEGECVSKCIANVTAFERAVMDFTASSAELNKAK